VRGRLRVDRRRLPDPMTPAMSWLQEALSADIAADPDAHRPPPTLHGRPRGSRAAVARGRAYLTGIAAALVGVAILALVIRSGPVETQERASRPAEPPTGTWDGGSSGGVASVTASTRGNFVEFGDSDANGRRGGSDHRGGPKGGSGSQPVTGGDYGEAAVGLPAGRGCPPGASDGINAEGAPAPPSSPAASGSETEPAPPVEAVATVAQQVDEQAGSLGVETDVGSTVRTAAETVDQVAPEPPSGVTPASGVPPPSVDSS
jgi:hypothetical protein